ncbi:hypothetical protein OAG88_02585, partial [Akkermansiaceae bacterium]|nr:hypothetical protein [Akkermansiaceae bacterium]
PSPSIEVNSRFKESSTTGGLSKQQVPPSSIISLHLSGGLGSRIHCPLGTSTACIVLLSSATPQNQINKKPPRVMAARG